MVELVDTLVSGASAQALLVRVQSRAPLLAVAYIFHVPVFSKSIFPPTQAPAFTPIGALLCTERFTLGRSRGNIIYKLKLEASDLSSQQPEQSSPKATSLLFRSNASHRSDEEVRGFPHTLF